MTSLKIFLFIFLQFTAIFAKISDKRLCADPTCSEPVSRAKTLLPYFANEHQLLSFKANEDITIYSKAAGSRTDLWGAELKGKRGYVPIEFVKEVVVFKADLKFLVPTESVAEGPIISTDSKAQLLNAEQEKNEAAKIASSSVKESFEVIDGTKIYLEPETTTFSHNEQLVTESPQQATTPLTPDTQKVLENLLQTPNVAKADDSSIDDSNNIEKHKITEKTNNEPIEIKINASEINVLNIPKENEPADKFENRAENIGVDGGPIDNDAEYDDEDMAYDEEEEEEEEKEDSQENVSDVNNNTSAEIEEKSTEIISETKRKTEPEFNKAQGAEILTEKVQQNVEISKNNKISDELLKNNAEDISKNDKISEGLLNNNAEDISKKNSGDLNNKISDELLKNNTEEISNKNSEDLNNKISDELLKNNTAEVSKKSSEDLNNKISDELLKNNTEKIYKDLNNQINETLLKNNTDEEAVKFVVNTDEKISTVPSKPLLVNRQNSFQKELISDPPQVPNSESSETTITDLLTESTTPEFYEISPSVPDGKNIKNDPTPEQINEVVTESLLYDQVLEIPKTEEEIIDLMKQVPEIPKIEDLLSDNSVTPEFIDIPDLTSQQTTETFVNINTNELKDDVHKIETINTNFENPTIISISDFETITEKPDQPEVEVTSEIASDEVTDDYSIFAKLYSLFGFTTEPVTEEPTLNMWGVDNQEISVNKYASFKEILTSAPDMQSCAASDNSNCAATADYAVQHEANDFSYLIFLQPHVNVILYLSITGITLLLFILGYYYLEKRNNTKKLVTIICDLEKKLLRTSKECQLVQGNLINTYDIAEMNAQSDKLVEGLKQELEDVQNVKQALETQISILEAELEKSTEAGVELSSMLDEMVVQQGAEPVIQNLRRDLELEEAKVLEIKEKVIEKNTENELLRTELSLANEKCSQLQDDTDKMMVNVLSIQEEKHKLQDQFESQLKALMSKHEAFNNQMNNEISCVKKENIQLKNIVEETQRKLDIKCNEFDLLREGMDKVEESKSNKGSLMKLLEVSQVKAEVQQLREEKKKLAEKLRKEVEDNLVGQQEMQLAMQEVGILKSKSDEAEKERVEAQTRLEVLSSYFKDKEAQLQKALNEHESKWLQKEGEASTTFERIKWIQEELQNYKSQNELLKKEILDQEVSLKSQISMLEKKSHDNWMHARQTERRLDESKQEASQLRNRLTIVEKNLNNSAVNQLAEDMIQNRLLSPLETNGDLGISPLHMSNVENPDSPPLLFPHRDHIPTSGPIPGLAPPPFLPPPPGVPFLPPPLPGVPPFMPPPNLFPGDHRPPPLGRMSSPPLRNRYSPDLRPYSPYDGDDSPPMSPGYPDDYRRRSPGPHMPPPKNYSPYNRPHYRNFRPHKGLSSGSGNSNESLENSDRNSGRI